MQLHTCRCILMLIVPNPDLSSNDVQRQPSGNRARLSSTLTHHTSNTEMNPAPPQTEFLPVSYSGQESSLFSPTQSHNPSSISSFLLNATHVIFQLQLLWGSTELPDSRLLSCYAVLQTPLTFSTLPACIALLCVFYIDSILHQPSKYSLNLLL